MKLRWVLLIPCLCSTFAAAQSTPAVSLRDPELDRRFAGADHNRDGALTRAEAQEGGFLVNEGSRFDAIDRDKNGTITLLELTQFVAEEVQDWLAADTNGDGQVSEAEAQQRSGSYAELMRRADANRDRLVTRTEFEMFGQRMYYQHGDLPSVAPNIFEKRF